MEVQFMDGSFRSGDRWLVPHENTVRSDRLLRSAAIGMSLVVLALIAALLCGVALCSHSDIGRDERVPSLGVGP